MAVDKFSKAQFEAALPEPWTTIGVVKGEWTYLCGIDDKTAVLIRSSVSQYGWSAASSDDSIRLVLCQYVKDDFGQPEHEWVPISTKIDTWTTRVAGWQKRMNAKINILKEWRVRAGDHCGMPKHIYRAHTPENDGRIFAKCKICGGGFLWLTE